MTGTEKRPELASSSLVENRLQVQRENRIFQHSSDTHRKLYIKIYKYVFPASEMDRSIASPQSINSPEPEADTTRPGASTDSILLSCDIIALQTAL